MVEVQAPYDQVVAEHEELREMSRELKDYLMQPRPEPGASDAHDWAEGLSNRLLRLHDKLSNHFREEEDSGFLDDIATTFPRIAHTAEELEVEHRQMLRELRGILPEALRLAEGRPDAGPGLRRRTEALLDQLASHEAKETELIERLYCEDLGRGA